MKERPPKNILVREKILLDRPFVYLLLTTLHLSCVDPTCLFLSAISPMALRAMKISTHIDVSIRYMSVCVSIFTHRVFFFFFFLENHATKANQDPTSYINIQLFANVEIVHCASSPRSPPPCSMRQPTGCFISY